MKKILLTTTALVGFYAGASIAEDLSVTLGGDVDAQAGFRSQKAEYLNKKNLTTGKVEKQGITANNKDVAFDTVSAIHASITGKSDSMKYGAQVGLQSTTRSQQSAGSNALDRTFVFMESDDMGRFEMGTNSGVSSTMRIGADNIARATGGIDGDWANYVSLDTYNKTGDYADKLVDHDNFVTGPSLFLTGFSGQNSGTPSAEYMQGDEKSRKVSYYTPKYNGFQFGLSYTPDNRNTGQDYMNELRDRSTYTNRKPTAKDAVAAGLTWEHDMAADQKLQLSLVGETASVKADQEDRASNVQKAYHKVEGFIFGAQYNYQNWAFAASYGNRGKSLKAKNTVDGDNKAVSMKKAFFYTAGVAYTQGAVGTSLTYMNSSDNKNKMDVVSLGMDYQLAPGLLPYAEVTYFNMKQKNNYSAGTPKVEANGETTAASAATVTKTNPEGKNKGTAFIIGTKINF